MRCSPVVAVFLFGCTSSNAVLCSDGRSCPATKVCDDEHTLCVFDEQLDVCNGVEDRTACAYKEADGTDVAGTCQQAVCLEAYCGNNRLDLPDLEICDDGNVLAGDGCSVNCLSTEVCGNGTTDVVNQTQIPEQCDDSNKLSHDGCSDSCLLERLGWSPIGDPVAQFEHRATYDVARNTVVMVGGYTNNGLLASTSTATSEWNGVWRGDIVSPPPTQLFKVGLAYDLDLRATVRYGGGGVNGPTGETWLWDGVSWERRADGPKRHSHAMAYDPKRKRVVVFGGADENDISQDTTLEFDGTSWQTVTPAVKPEAREDAMMAYDAKRGVIVMVGGGGSISDPNGAVWEYDGVTWTRKAPSGSVPNYLNGMTFAYDPVSTNALLYGGNGGSGPTGAMWLWDGTSWTSYVGTTPPARLDSVMTYDGRGRILLFGGRNATSGGPATLLADTWVWDGAVWTQLQTLPPRAFGASAAALDQGKLLRVGGEDGSGTYTNEVWEGTRAGWKRFITGSDPPVRQFGSLVYDEKHGQFMLFGGILADNTADPKVYLRTGTTWTSSQPAGPAGRALAQVVYDAARGEVIVYGGVDAQFNELSDMWSWDGTQWKSLTPAHLPTARHGAATGYDPIAQNIVMFGGADDGNDPVPETWIWDGTDWTNVTPPTGPATLLYAPFVWNAARRALTVAGPGFTFIEQSFETWEWVSALTSPPSGTWRRVSTSTRPSNRAASTVLPQLDGAGIEVSHGLAFTASLTLRTDVLELVSRGPTSSDSCELAFDVDGDSLIGCDDPDCWPVCSPRCPPGVTCPPAAPRCGDGTCSSIESCRSCPVDCTSCTGICGNFVCEPNETQCPGDC